MKDKTGKPARHEEPAETEAHSTDDPSPATKTKSFGEALDELGFVPLDPPRRIILRRFGPPKRLKRWRKPKEQE